MRKKDLKLTFDGEPYAVKPYSLRKLRETEDVLRSVVGSKDGNLAIVEKLLQIAFGDEVDVGELVTTPIEVATAVKAVLEYAGFQEPAGAGESGGATGA